MSRNRVFGVVLAGLIGLIGVVVTPTAALAAYDYTAPETNTAVAGTLPSSVNTSTDCVSITGSTVCFEAYGDRWWVKDTAADSASAVADWENFVSGSNVVRNGQCTNSLGNGKWGYCNKNYVEGSLLFVEAKVYDASAGKWLPQVSNPGYFYA